jgi:hypothetical protein
MVKVAVVLLRKERDLIMRLRGFLSCQSTICLMIGDDQDRCVFA